MQFLFVLLVFAASSAGLQHVSRYVLPDYSTSSSCPDMPCLTLDQYASQQAKYFTTGSTFLFLAGSHSINTYLLLRNISDVALLAMKDKSNVTVFFKATGFIEIREVSNLRIQGMTFMLHSSLNNNQSTIISVFDSTGIVLVDNTFLQKNSSDVKIGGINSMRSILFIKCCYFEGLTSAQYGGACYFSTSNVTLDGNVFHNNRAGVFGGAIFLDGDSSLVFNEVVGNTFTYNSAEKGGGAIGCYYCTITTEKFDSCNNLSIKQASHGMQTHTTPHTHATYFSNNQALGGSGGAIFFYQSTSSIKGVIIFQNNSAQRGGAIDIDTLVIVYFAGYTVLQNNHARSRGGAMNVNTKSIVLFTGPALFEANLADEDGGGIYAVSSAVIIMRNDVVFEANLAKQDGGAMFFVSEAKLVLARSASLLLSENRAKHHGGAIFHEDSITPDQCRFQIGDADVRGISDCFLDFEPSLDTSYQYYIYSRNNTADQGGNFLYGGLLDKCLVVAEKNRNFYNIPLYLLQNNTINLPSYNSDTQPIMSKPYKLCFCSSTYEYNCTAQISVETHRGVTFTVPLLALAQGDAVTSSPVRAIVKHSARLLPDQRSQDLQHNCTDMPFNMFSTEEKEQLVLYLDGGPCSDIGLSRAVLNVTLLPCPDAFTLSGDQCVCEERLQAYNASCSVVSNTEFYITRKAGSSYWVNAIMKSGKNQGLVLCPVCPLDYCKSDTVNITLADPDIQCDYNRSGVLCGACRANYSLTFGSSTCELCSNAHLALLLPFAAAGIALVVFLTVLRLTVATGAINSIILYANIVQANRNIFFSSSSSSIFSVFIAWLNLDLGFHSCFYNGMDAYAQTWLQLAFPLYVWILISLIILASRHSLTVTKLIGSNPIAVLATLLLMSYTKLLKIVIEVFSSIDLEYPGNKTVTAWLKDANVPYLQTWHLALTVVVTLLLVFLFLPYTLLLLLGYKLYRFTGKKYSQWLIAIKPLLDAYYAPCKMHTRYWTGFLLLVRCALYIVFSYNSIRDTNRSRFAIVITFSVIMVWLSLKIYSKLLINILEVIVYSNLIVLSAAPLASFHSPVLVDILVGMVFAIMMGIIVYHFHIFYITNSALWLKLCAKITAKPSEATPLLASVSPPQEACATLPRKKPTHSVFSFDK